MKMPFFASLTASVAFLASGALAQTMVGGNDPYRDVPQMRLRPGAPPPPQQQQQQAAPAPGVTWQARPRVEMRQVPMAPTPPVVTVRAPQMSAPQVQMVPQAPQVRVVTQGAPQVRMIPPGMGMAPQPGTRRNVIVRRDGMRDGQWSANRYRDYRRIERGGFVPNYWSGTGFTVDNWGMYGLPAPFEGGRWIRYYDDALMMGPDGRVLDGRYGMDWDRFGDRWSFDEHGVPVYVGHGDFYPTQRDYAWVEHYDQGRAYAQAPAMGPPMGAPMPGQGYGYQQAWAGSAGYSASSWGTMPIVTETVITEPATVETRTYVEERVVTSRARRVVRHHAPRHRLRCVPTCCSCPVR